MSRSESEPNSSSATADTVPLDTRISAEVSSASDTAYFAFQAKAGDASQLVGDSRFTHRAEEGGWYTASVHDLEPRDDLDQTYVLTIRALPDDIQRFSVTATPPDGLGANQFNPVLQLFRDERQQPLAAPAQDLTGERELSKVLLPGKYMLLVYNRPGVAARHTLTPSLAPVN